MSTQSSKNILLAVIWGHVFTCRDIDIEVLAKDIIKDCGVDTRGLNQSDILLLLRDENFSRWNDLAWAFTESLAAYSALGLQRDDVPRVMYMALCLAEAVALSRTDPDIPLKYVFEVISMCVCFIELWMIGGISLAISQMFIKELPGKEMKDIASLLAASEFLSIRTG